MPFYYARAPHVGACPPPTYPPYVQNTANMPYEGAFAAPSPPRSAMRCNEQGGCALYQTPSSLYPTTITVPMNMRVAALSEQGEWFETVYGGRRGWLPRSQFVDDSR